MKRIETLSAVLFFIISTSLHAQDYSGGSAISEIVIDNEPCCYMTNLRTKPKTAYDFSESKRKFSSKQDIPKDALFHTSYSALHFGVYKEEREDGTWRLKPRGGATFNLLGGEVKVRAKLGRFKNKESKSGDRVNRGNNELKLTYTYRF